MNSDFKKNTPKIFYDGSCGLCHCFVRFSLNNMKLEYPFIFSPLYGKLFHKTIKNSNIEVSVDSIIVFDPINNKVLDKGMAVIFILDRIGGKWKVLSCFLKKIPICILNLGYIVFSKTRNKFFPRPSSVCPLFKENLRKFFAD